MENQALFFDLQYFVRMILRNGTEDYEPYRLAEKWYANQSGKGKDKSIILYRAYHIISELLPVWAEREGVYLLFPEEKNVKISPQMIKEIESELKKQRYKLLIPLKEMKEKELSLMHKRLLKQEKMPEYLENLLVLKKDYSKFLEKKGIEDKLNGLNTVFIALFVLVVMLLNL